MLTFWFGLQAADREILTQLLSKLESLETNMAKFDDLTAAVAAQAEAINALLPLIPDVSGEQAQLTAAITQVQDNTAKLLDVVGKLTPPADPAADAPADPPADPPVDEPAK